MSFIVRKRCTYCSIWKNPTGFCFHSFYTDSGTTFVIDPKGEIIGKYDKIHADFEVVNELGKEHSVFKTKYAPIGVLVCADRQFPEAARSSTLKGARVLIINSYGMWGEGANERFR